MEKEEKNVVRRRWWMDEQPGQTEQSKEEEGELEEKGGHATQSIEASTEEREQPEELASNEKMDDDKETDRAVREQQAAEYADDDKGKEQGFKEDVVMTEERADDGEAKEQETIRADLQYQILDRRSQGRVSALDVFAGLSLLCHDSMENRLRFVFKLVDFTRNGALNMAELILLFGASLRGIARMKGIFPDAPYWHAERLAREVFRKGGVHP